MARVVGWGLWGAFIVSSNRRPYIKSFTQNNLRGKDLLHSLVIFHAFTNGRGVYYRGVFRFIVFVFAISNNGLYLG